MHVRQIKRGGDRGVEAKRGEAIAGRRERCLATDTRPLLMLDIDGVISLFGFPLGDPPPGRFHAIEGVPHYLSATAANQLARLSGAFELVWASGWEERANDHLPHLLGLQGPLPFLTFDRAGRTNAGGPGTSSAGRPGTSAAGTSGPGSSMRAHWKLAAVEAHAGERPLAWVDDAFNEACERWAAARTALTLLVATEPAVGLTEDHTARLIEWAAATPNRNTPTSPPPQHAMPPTKGAAATAQGGRRGRGSLL